MRRSEGAFAAAGGEAWLYVMSLSAGPKADAVCCGKRRRYRGDNRE